MDTKLVSLRFKLSDDGDLLMADGSKPNQTLSCGYRMVRFDGQKEHCHRIVFFLANGYLPEFVDHIDGCRENNSPSNLSTTARAHDN